MHGLISGAFGGAHPLDAQRDFFRAHLAPWIGRFFADLEKTGSARFYAAVGALGRLVINGNLNRYFVIYRDRDFKTLVKIL